MRRVAPAALRQLAEAPGVLDACSKETALGQPTDKRRNSAIDKLWFRKRPAIASTTSEPNTGLYERSRAWRGLTPQNNRSRVSLFPSCVGACLDTPKTGCRTSR